MWLALSFLFFIYFMASNGFWFRRYFVASYVVDNHTMSQSFTEWVWVWVPAHAERSSSSFTANTWIVDKWKKRQVAQQAANELKKNGEKTKPASTWHMWKGHLNNQLTSCMYETELNVPVKLSSGQNALPRTALNTLQYSVWEKRKSIWNLSIA